MALTAAGLGSASLAPVDAVVLSVGPRGQDGPGPGSPLPVCSWGLKPPCVCPPGPGTLSLTQSGLTAPSKGAETHPGPFRLPTGF